MRLNVSEMRTTLSSMVLAIMTLLWTAFASPSAAQSLPSAASTRGEDYFLIRTLEMLYEQWPQNVTTPDEFTAVASELRREAIRLKVRAERANSHPSVIDGFSDFVSQLDAFTTFLVNIGAIQKAGIERANTEEFGSGFKGGLAAAGTYGELSQYDDVSGGEAALASLIVGGLTYAIDSWSKASARDEAARSAVNAEAQRIQDSFVATLERTRQRFSDLARSKGWDDHEIGWNLSPAQAQAVLNMYSQGDVNGLAAEAARQRAARPFDPFIALFHNDLQSLQSPDGPAALDQLSADSYSLRLLIPSDDVYSDYRLGAVSQAAFLASNARNAERKAGAPAHSSERSRRAVELWEDVYRSEPSDPTGEIRLYRAMAYAADGNPTKARRELERIFEPLKEDAQFLYACAWILCLDGDLDQSLKFLSWALSTDMLDLAQVRTNHDLADLRRNRNDEFQEITTPQVIWNVQNGIVFADVSLTNNSDFSLTNVRLVSTTPDWNPDLAVEVLRPGETKKWGWVSQPPADRRLSASLQCDQDP